MAPSRRFSRHRPYGSAQAEWVSADPRSQLAALSCSPPAKLDDSPAGLHISGVHQERVNARANLP